MSNGRGREIDLTKVDSITGNDFVRVLKGSASRNISLTNLIDVLNSLLNRTVNVVTTTTNYLATNQNDVILVDVTAGDLTVTLPDASGNNGLVLQVKKISTATNDVTVQTSGGNIDGSPTVTLSGSGGAMPGIALVSDGTNWYITNA